MLAEPKDNAGCQGTAVANFDLFFSYPWADAVAAHQLADALEKRGVRLWLDRVKVEHFEDITHAIDTGLAHAKAILCFYSQGYAKSRICQWELTAAYVAAQRAGEPKERVLIVNPVATSSHIPEELRRTLFASLPTSWSDADLDEVAEAVSKHVATLQNPLGSLQRLQPPTWYPTASTPWPRFVGRVSQLWKIHSLLHKNESVGIHGRPAAANAAHVHGLGGIGKTMLAEEYAHRFGMAYPGGIFWLRAKGENQDATRELEIQNVAKHRGISTKGLSYAEVVAALRRDFESKNKACLWIVDDVPPGLSHDDVRQWLAPHPLCRTLFTTRSQRYQVGEGIELSVLEPEEALDLLRKCVGELRGEDLPEARALLEDLGHHALACEVVGARLTKTTIRDVRQELADRHEDALEFAAEFSNELPHDQQANVTALLFASLEHLGADGRDFLRLASILASEPIPQHLVRGVFEKLGSTAEHGDLGLDQAQKLSLARRTNSDAWSVHALVSRAVRFRDEQEGIDTVRDGLLDFFSALLPSVADIRAHDALKNDVAHARHVTSRAASSREANVLSWVARYDSQKGLYASSRALQEHVLDVSRRELGEEHPGTLAAMNNLATTLWCLGDFQGAQEVEEHVLVVRRRVLGEEHPDTLTSMNNLAETLRNQGKLGGLRELQEDLLKIRRRMLGEEHPDTLQSMNNLASTLMYQGDLPEARKLQEQVLMVARRVLGEGHQDTLAAINNLAGTLFRQGDLQGALTLHEDVLAVGRRVLGEEHPDTLTFMSNLAETLWSQGDIKGAREINGHVLGIRRRVLGEEHPDTLTSMNNLAQTLRKPRDLPKARKLHEHVLAVRRRVLGEEHPDTLISMDNLAGARRDSGDLKKARELHQHVLTVRRRVLGEEDPVTLSSMYYLAATLRKQGDVRGARELVACALECARRTLAERVAVRVALEEAARGLGL